jgi:hypothetical protein
MELGRVSGLDPDYREGAIRSRGQAGVKFEAIEGTRGLNQPCVQRKQGTKAPARPMWEASGAEQLPISAYRYSLPKS